MQIITSRDNSLYKEIRHIATRSHARRKSARTLLDGIHLCQSYLQFVGAPFVCVIAADAQANPEISEIVAQCEKASSRCISLPENLFRPLSQVESGTGILFLIDRPQHATPEVLEQSAVLLDQVQDPGNLGSIMRSAAAAGIKQIYCSAGTAQVWSPRVLRAAMGAHFMLQVYENVDLAALMRNAKVPVVATSPHQEQTVFDLDLSQPVAWLFGHEGQGVADDLLAAAAYKVAIPHLGEMESLNVAASAAICFFEQVRQKR